MASGTFAGPVENSVKFQFDSDKLQSGPEAIFPKFAALIKIVKLSHARTEKGRQCNEKGLYSQGRLILRNMENVDLKVDVGVMPEILEDND